jgi:hypothetical protein
MTFLKLTEDLKIAGVFFYICPNYLEYKNYFNELPKIDVTEGRNKI